MTILVVIFGLIGYWVLGIITETRQAVTQQQVEQMKEEAAKNPPPSTQPELFYYYDPITGKCKPRGYKRY